MSSELTGSGVHHLNITPACAGVVENDRSSDVAVKAIRSLAERWVLSPEEAAALLGVESGMWEQISLGVWTQPLSQEQLTRASAMIGIYKELHELFLDGMSDRWPRLQNQGSIFQGRSPVQFMLAGGVSSMLQTRTYVENLKSM